MKILVDVDDVIAKGGILYLINEYLKTNYVEEDFKDYYMQDIIPDKDKFFDFFFEKNLYDYVELCAGVKDALKYLNEKYEVYICTAYLFREYPNRCGNILSQKFNFLIKELPFLKPQNFIFMSNKTLVNADVRIDDRIDNLPKGSKNILFTAYHNKEISDEVLLDRGVVRANNWMEVVKIIEDDL